MRNLNQSIGSVNIVKLRVKTLVGKHGDKKQSRNDKMPSKLRYVSQDQMKSTRKKHFIGE